MNNPYLAGRNQYGGSSSANAGMTLNPTGYMQRESDKRSQLAQGFMQNQQNNIMQPQTGGLTGTTNFAQRTATGRLIPMATTYQPPTAPNVSAPTGMPADEQYNLQAYQASTDYQNQARALLEARQNAELNYANQTRGLQQVLDKLPGQVRSEAARSGLLRSSRFTTNLENQTNELGNQIEAALADQNFADKTYTSGLADLGSQYTGLMGLAAQQLASRNAANAGKLGIGTVNPADKNLTESAIGKQIQDMVKRPTNTPSGTNPAIKPPTTANPPTTAPKGISIPSGIYRQGYNNPSLVKQIQTLVGTKADGVWGPNTTTAIKTWQRNHGLVADGIIGPKTIAAMAKG